MSLATTRQVDAEHPHLLRTNIGSTCHEFTQYVIAALLAEGHDAYLMCKSPGEGQYVPPGFQQRMVTGLDGKQYLCSGVSHDAIWCDGKQLDVIGSANEYDRPIYRVQGEGWETSWSFDSAAGPQIVGLPRWAEIDRTHWRANNPPLKEGIPALPTEPPTFPPQPPPQPYPGDEVWDAVGVILFADYAEAGQDPNPLMGRWFGRTIWDATEGDESGMVLTVDASIAKHRTEWRGALGLPPP